MKSIFWRWRNVFSSLFLLLWLNVLWEFLIRIFLFRGANALVKRELLKMHIPIHMFCFFLAISLRYLMQALFTYRYALLTFTYMWNPQNHKLLSAISKKSIKTCQTSFYFQNALKARHITPCFIFYVYESINLKIQRLT